MCIQKIGVLKQFNDSELVFVSNDGKERIILTTGSVVPDMSTSITYPHAIGLLMKNVDEELEVEKFHGAVRLIDDALMKLRYSAANERRKKWSLT